MVEKYNPAVPKSINVPIRIFGLKRRWEIGLGCIFIEGPVPVECCFDSYLETNGISGLNSFT
jgi:hypothetical protein